MANEILYLMGSYTFGKLLLEYAYFLWINYLSSSSPVGHKAIMIESSIHYITNLFKFQHVT